MNNQEENIEELLFEYVEGTLSSNEIEELKNLLIINSSLQDDLVAWEVAHIEKEIYETSSLESSILNKTFGSYHFTWYLNAFLIMCFTFISSIEPEISGNIPHFIKMTPLTYPIHLENTSSNVVISTIEPLTLFKVDVQKVKVMPVRNSSVIDVLNFELNVSRVKEVPTLPHVIYKTPLENTISTTIIKTLASQIVLKKPNAIRKTEKQQKRKKAISEFLKGNALYVVPIGIQNF